MHETDVISSSAQPNLDNGNFDKVQYFTKNSITQDRSIECFKCYLLSIASSGSTRDVPLVIRSPGPATDMECFKSGKFIKHFSTLLKVLSHVLSIPFSTRMRGNMKLSYHYKYYNFGRSPPIYSKKK